ncbi:unnamed protein product [Dicrocoelium dendriticum]|nr:unnamed protein product [Dicrocoelium dendriticum]
MTDFLWFCIKCSSLPLVRCITLLAQNCDRLSKIVEQATTVKAVPYEPDNSVHNDPCSTSCFNLERCKNNVPVLVTATVAAARKDAFTAHSPPEPPTKLKAVKGTTAYASVVTTHTAEAPFIVTQPAAKQVITSVTTTVLKTSSSTQAKKPVTDPHKKVDIKKRHNPLTVICSNVTESGANSIKDKILDDKNSGTPCVN